EPGHERVPRRPGDPDAAPRAVERPLLAAPGCGPASDVAAAADRSGRLRPQPPPRTERDPQSAQTVVRRGAGGAGRRPHDRPGDGPRAASAAYTEPHAA